MKIQPFVLGIGYTNCYVAYFDDKSAYIIDAPNGTEAVQAFIDKNNLKVLTILLTHGHYDHILGLSELVRTYPNARVYISKEDYSFLENGSKANLDILRGQREILEYFKDSFNAIPQNINYYGDTIGLFEVLKTPGHTLGSICLYSEKENVLFSGDTLFRNGIGRWDLGGDYSAMISSISYLKTLPDNTLVLPGHGESTTIKEEKESNPYF